MKVNKKEALIRWNEKWRKHLEAHKFVLILEEELRDNFFYVYNLSRCSLWHEEQDSEIHIYFDNKNQSISLKTNAAIFKYPNSNKYVLEIGGEQKAEFLSDTGLYAMIETFPWRVFNRDIS